MLVMFACVAKVSAHTKGLDELYAIYGEQTKDVIEYTSKNLTNVKKDVTDVEGKKLRREQILEKTEAYLIYFDLLKGLKQKSENGYFDHSNILPGFRKSWTGATGDKWEDFSAAGAASGISTQEDIDLRYALAEVFYNLGGNDKVNAALRMQKMILSLGSK